MSEGARKSNTAAYMRDLLDAAESLSIRFVDYAKAHQIPLTDDISIPKLLREIERLLAVTLVVESARHPGFNTRDSTPPDSTEP